MYWIWTLLAILVAVIWVFALIDVVRSRHTMSAGKIATWVILILVLPVVGAMTYFVVHGSGGSSGAPRDAEMGGRPL